MEHHQRSRRPQWRRRRWFDTSSTSFTVSTHLSSRVSFISEMMLMSLLLLIVMMVVVVDTTADRRRSRRWHR
ncbi:hypothetical protein HanRHA438_Chr16g0754261 [Helianthus annuus]|nr:hypothetical protein HanRHA438_Chr16g0754261 [Helianthus annuus]